MMQDLPQFDDSQHAHRVCVLQGHSMTGFANRRSAYVSELSHHRIMYGESG